MFYCDARNGKRGMYSNEKESSWHDNMRILYPLEGKI